MGILVRNIGKSMEVHVNFIVNYWNLETTYENLGQLKENIIL
jgi:hypothetical protein